MSPVETIVARVLAERCIGGCDPGCDDTCVICRHFRHDVAAEIAAALRADEGLVEAMAEHWHWDDDEVGAFRCGYVERREPCPIPERLYAFTPSELAAERARVWDEGYTSGHSNAMRRMSDEPDAPTTPNPYRRAMAEAMPGE